MEAKIVAIGNSQGVRLPKAVLRRARLSVGQTVNIDVAAGSRIVITREKHPRAGWEEAFRQDPPRKTDYPWRDIPPTLANDDKEWTW